VGVADKVQISVVESDNSSDSFNCYLNEIGLLGIVNDTHLYTVSTVYMSLSHTYDITVFCIDGLYLFTHAIAADHLSLSNNMTLNTFLSIFVIFHIYNNYLCHITRYQHIL